MLPKNTYKIKNLKLEKGLGKPKPTPATLKLPPHPATHLQKKKKRKYSKRRRIKYSLNDLSNMTNIPKSIKNKTTETVTNGRKTDPPNTKMSIAKYKKKATPTKKTPPHHPQPNPTDQRKKTQSPTPPPLTNHTTPRLSSPHHINPNKRRYKRPEKKHREKYCIY